MVGNPSAMVRNLSSLVINPTTRLEIDPSNLVKNIVLAHPLLSEKIPKKIVCVKQKLVNLKICSIKGSATALSVKNRNDSHDSMMKKLIQCRSFVFSLLFPVFFHSLLQRFPVSVPVRNRFSCKPFFTGRFCNSNRYLSTKRCM